MTHEDQDLSPAAATLARTAPEAWKQFKAAMVRYAERKREDMMSASLDELQKAQGRAQACNAIALILADAEKAADRIADRISARR